jgi:hypothetical protein
MNARLPFLTEVNRGASALSRWSFTRRNAPGAAQVRDGECAVPVAWGAVDPRLGVGGPVGGRHVTPGYGDKARPSVARTNNTDRFRTESHQLVDRFGQAWLKSAVRALSLPCRPAF